MNKKKDLNQERIAYLKDYLKIYLILYILLEMCTPQDLQRPLLRLLSLQVLQSRVVLLNLWITGSSIPLKHLVL